jgi:hypothetical protein
MRLGRPTSKLVSEKNGPPSHPYAQWDIALLSVRLDRFEARDLEADVILA